MQRGENSFHRTFAGLSWIFLLLVASTLLSSPAHCSSDNNSATKRDAASSQFARAEELRATLNAKALEKRTLLEYKKVVNSYQRVYLITPHAAEVPDAILAVAELNTEMGDRFGRSYYQNAVEAYQFLIHDYPASKYVQDSMLRVAKLQKDQLGEPEAATKTFQEFQKAYPHSPRRREVQEALAELALLRSSESGAVVSRNSREPDGPWPRAEVLPAEPRGEVAKSGRVALVERIRTSVTADSTEVVIELDNAVQYASGRIANPDRIYFDLHAARVSASALRNNVHVSGDLLTKVRIAQYQSNVVRVVLDVSGVTDYAASLTKRPPRLLIELYGSAPVKKHAVETAESNHTNSDTGTAGEGPALGTASAKAAAAEASGAGGTDAARRPDAAASPPTSNPTTTRSDSATVTATTTKPDATSSSAKTATRTKSGKSMVTSKADPIQPATMPQPTHDGQSTLTRALGLKIGRIVIDAGHGGHDTGTIGPTGLMEKDLCLDVALRLGKIIQQKLPGAEIVYTRSDDTFIPLEERTRIANEAKADLFVSIHANSSPDRGARGVETYYLNLRGSPEAMEVAARENAASQEGIHDLEDVVKQIARTEKIDESRELAGDIQDSLARRIQRTARPVKNRGVRKAPFVVLIGADMPSILTEVSFLSNPADEQLLKKPEHRQRVAEGLYQGVAQYLRSLNSVTVNSSGKPSRAPAASSIEQTRNQK